MQNIYIPQTRQHIQLYNIVPLSTAKLQVQIHEYIRMLVQHAHTHIPTTDQQVVQDQLLACLLLEELSRLSAMTLRIRINNLRDDLQVYTDASIRKALQASIRTYELLLEGKES